MSPTLAGTRVVVTRAAHQSAELVALLEARGARVIEMPLIAVEEPADGGRERDTILRTLARFDWVVVTSPNAAPLVGAHLGSVSSHDGVDSPKIAVVGRATEIALGRRAELVAEPARGSALVEAFPRGSGRVLVVQGDLADDTVARGIAGRGWGVTSVVAYRTVTLVPEPSVAADALAADVLMLASGSAARAWVQAMGPRTPSVVVCIGPSTAAAAEAAGIEVTVTASRQSIEEMVRCAERALSDR